MKIKIIAVAAALCAVSFPISLTSAAFAEEDPEFKAYVQSLFLVPGKAQDEFQRLANANPLLTSYALALFAERRCSLAPASSALSTASGGMEAFNTDTGKRIFAVTGVVATMKFPTRAAESSFCESAKALIRAGEKHASGEAG